MLRCLVRSVFNGPSLPAEPTRAALISIVELCRAISIEPTIFGPLCSAAIDSPLAADPPAVTAVAPCAAPAASGTAHSPMSTLIVLALVNITIYPRVARVTVTSPRQMTSVCESQRIRAIRTLIPSLGLRHDCLMGGRRNADGLNVVSRHVSTAAVLLGAGVVCVMPVACGGTTPTTGTRTPSSASLSSTELAARGSAICARAAAEEKALHVRNMASALPRVKEIGKAEFADLAKLSPPSSEQTSYNAFLAGGSEVTELLGTLQAALSGGGRPSPSLLARGRELTARMAEVDRQLGMGICSAEAPSSG